MNVEMNDKEPYAFLGEGLRDAGFNLALIDHFSILEEQARPKGVILEALREMCPGAGRSAGRAG